MELEGRVALVTGAARRVGRAITLRLARAGCRVAVHYHTSREQAGEVVTEARAIGVEARAFHADLADPEHTAALARDARDAFGGLDILVNNAAVFRKMSLDDFDIEQWEHTLRVNLTSAMVLTHAARDALHRAGGRVINISDAGAATHPWPDHLAYSVSKAALDALTRALARALAPEVNVVGIAPGVAQWPDDYTEHERARLLKRIPLQHAGTPEQIAEVAHFFLRHADYVTGAILPVDGGRHLG